MEFLSKIRIPYKNDYVFGFLFLTVFLVPLAFSLYNFESFEIIKFGLLSVFLGSAGIILFKRRLQSQSFPLILRHNRIFFLFFGLFLFWALLASIFSVDKNFAFFGFYPRFTNGFLFFCLLGVLFFFLASLNKEQNKILLKVLFFTSVLTAVWGLLQSVGIGYYGGLSTDAFSRSAPSFLGNPNFSSMFVVALAPVGPSFMFLAKTFWAKIVYGLSLFLQICAVVIFASRGSLLGLMLGLTACLTLVLIFRKKFEKKVIVTFLVSISLLFLISFGFLNFARPGTVTQTLSLTESNLKQRLDIWSLSLRGVKLHPVFGYGPGNFELFFEQNRQFSSVKTNFFDDPHNLYLYMAVAGGLPLLMFFLFWVFWPMIGALKRLLSSQETDSLFILSVLGAIISWLVAACFTPVAISCFLVLVVLLSSLFNENKEFEIKFSKFSNAAGLGVFSFLLLYGLCFLIAENLFFSSIRVYNEGNFKKSHSLAKTAIWLNPVNSLYYEYLAGSAIRANKPMLEIEKEIQKFSAFHKARSYTYIQIANIYYLLLYQSQSLIYKPVILSNLNKAIAMDPDAVSNYFVLSQYQFVFGDLQASKSAVLKALSLSPDDFDSNVFLAKIYQFENNRSGMEDVLKKLLLLRGADPGVQNILRMIKSGQGLQSLPFNVSFRVGKLE